MPPAKCCVMGARFVARSLTIMPRAAHAAEEGVGGGGGAPVLHPVLGVGSRRDWMPPPGALAKLRSLTLAASSSLCAAVEGAVIDAPSSSGGANA